MGSLEDPRTSPTLLGRLRTAPLDQPAWEEFVRRYAPRVYAWCRHWGLQHADAEDVTQDVLVRMARALPTFTYDPTGSFRAWLQTVARHAWCNHLKHRRLPGRGAGSGDTQVLEMLHTVEAQTDLLHRLDEEFDRELLDEAMARVRLRVEPRTWEAFRLLALDGLSGAEGARHLHMSVAGVYVARGRVQHLIQKELERLEGPRSFG